MPSHKCYNEEVIYYKNPSFQSIEHTFLITMQTSTRRTSYLKQLDANTPTKKVTILHNSGYQKCSKPRWVNNTMNDLWSVNREILHKISYDTLYTKAKYILVLEDDVQFTPDFKKHVGEIEDFLYNKPTVELYSLGCVPILTFPSLSSHIAVYFASGAHAVLYSRNACKRMYQMCSGVDCMLSIPHDIFIHKKLTSYMYYKSLAYQSHQNNTDNMSNWPILGVYFIKVSNIFFSHPYIFSQYSSNIGGILPLIVLFLFCAYAILHIFQNKIEKLVFVGNPF